jgi:hypothetical protein
MDLSFFKLTSLNSKLFHINYKISNWTFLGLSRDIYKLDFESNFDRLMIITTLSLLLYVNMQIFKATDDECLIRKH